MNSYKKVGIVPDVHGNPKWKNWVTTFILEGVDEIVFLGDYVDSYNYEDDEILSNLHEILDFKKGSPVNTTLLMGNHDIQYYGNGNEYFCSGYRKSMYNDLHDIYNTPGYFDNLYTIGDTVFTHAGISSYWHSKYFTGYSITELLEEIPGIRTKRQGFDLLATVGRRRGGFDTTGGPFWADKAEILNYPISGLHQYVGHTPVNDLEVHRINDNTSITFCDTLGYGKPIVVNVSLNTTTTDGRVIEEKESN